MNVEETLLRAVEDCKDPRKVLPDEDPDGAGMICFGCAVAAVRRMLKDLARPTLTSVRQVPRTGEGTVPELPTSGPGAFPPMPDIPRTL